MEKRKALASLALFGVLAGLLLFGFGGLGMASGASAQSFNNVQVSLQTQNSTDNYFAVDVYNSTGGLVASSQSQYPAFSFELPSSSYIFTATALYSSSSYSGYYGSQDTEYGYQSQQVSTSSTLTISTQKLSDISQTRISVQVNFANGTAVSGAAVSTQALGSYYYWGNNFTMWNQTNSEGNVTLTVPNVPVEINAWDWVYVNLPSSVTTVHTTVAGQPINVTVYWEPMYVPFSGTALIIPPQSSTQITLKYTPEQNYCLPIAEGAPAASNAPAKGTNSISSSGNAILPCYFYGITASSSASQGSGGGTASPQVGSSNGIASPSLLPATQAPQSSIGSGPNSSSPPSLLDAEIEVGVGIAAAISAISLFAFLMIRRTQRQKGPF